MTDTIRYRVARNFALQRDTENGVVLWDAAAGVEIELGRAAHAILGLFAVPRSVASLLDGLGSSATSAERLRRAAEALAAAGLLEPDVDDAPHRSDSLTTGMFGARLRRIESAVADPSVDVIMFGAEYDAGVSGRAGARFAPDAVRRVASSLFSPVGERGMWDPALGRRVLANVTLADVGNLGSPVQRRNGPILDEVTRLVSVVSGASKLPVMVGGDHSLSHAFVNGLVASGRTPLGILHFDAHSDYSAPARGNWRSSLHHGNVMSWIAGIPEVRDIVQFGIRQRVDDGPTPDDAAVRQWAGRSALEVPVNRLLDTLPDDLSWHLTIDVDVLDPSVLPSTGTPVPDGLLQHELQQLVRRVASERSVVGIDVVELVGDTADHSALVTADVLLHAIDAATIGRNDAER